LETDIMTIILRLRRPTLDSRIDAALGARDHRALRHLEREAARAAESATGPTWLETHRTLARVQAARRYLAGWRHHG
jgi:hypothetical protein